MLKPSALFFIIFSFQLIHCTPARSVVKIGKLPNFDKQVENHILFLDFLVTQEDENGPVKAKLVNSVAGFGKMKPAGSGRSRLNQIKAIHFFRDQRQPAVIYYEHPLFRSVEIFDKDGHLSQDTQPARDGTLPMRFQDDPAREKIELYSITPKGEVRIFSLLVKK